MYSYNDNRYNYSPYDNEPHQLQRSKNIKCKCSTRSLVQPNFDDDYNVEFDILEKGDFAEKKSDSSVILKKSTKKKSRKKSKPSKASKATKKIKREPLERGTPYDRKSLIEREKATSALLPLHGDGMKPLETMHETTDVFTNAFKTDKYEGAVSRRKPAPAEDLSHPVSGWLPFQVPIVPHPDDTDFERQATKEYSLTRLLHNAKSSQFS